MRFPLSALTAATGLSEAALGRQVRLSGSSLTRAREMGLTADAADRYAIRAGLHPAEVWDGWYDDVEVVCGSVDCDVRFVPHDRQARYCSKRCRSREKQRRYRLTPSGAEANRAYRRRYYAECRSYELARAKRAAA